MFFTPDSDITGFTYLPTIPCWVFLIEHSSGRKVLFDLGIRKDWRNLSSQVVAQLDGLDFDIKIEKDVFEILADGGIAGEEIDSIIWRYVEDMPSPCRGSCGSNESWELSRAF